jgi:general secretion pathway protein G
MNKQENRTAREALRQGFTLIEILVVVAIIGMLGAVAVPAYINYLADARRETTRALIKSVDDALVTYNAKHGGKYPDSLDVLTQETEDEDAILQGGIDDPWGNELKYEKRGKKRPLLTSAGPDGEFGTDDDITNLDKDKIKK